MSARYYANIVVGIIIQKDSIEKDGDLKFNEHTGIAYTPKIKVEGWSANGEMIEASLEPSLEVDDGLFGVDIFHNHDTDEAILGLSVSESGDINKLEKAGIHEVKGFDTLDIPKEFTDFLDEKKLMVAAHLFVHCSY